MKKALAIILLFSTLLLTGMSAQNFINVEHEFVQWRMPDDWKPFQEDFMPGAEYYSGEIEPGNEMSDGAVFAVVTVKGFAKEIISEMKQDPQTNLQIEANNYLNGMEREYYEGLIDERERTTWFTLSFFPAEEDHGEFMVFGIASGPNMNQDKAVLNHIISSVDVQAETFTTPDTPLNSASINLLNSDTRIYSPGTSVEFVYQVDESLLKSSPWIGIVPSDIPHGEESENDKHDLTYIYFDANQGQKSIRAPSKEGFYDLRMHDTDFNGKELAYISFEVKEDTDLQPVITTDKQVYNPGEAISITFKNAPAETSKDWIGVYRTSSDESGYLSWQYLDGKETGELTFTSPRDAGEYNIRLFNDDSYNTIAVSHAFQVSEVNEPDQTSHKEAVFISSSQFCSAVRDGKGVDSKLKFSQRDERIYILLTIEEYQLEHTLTYEWIKPNGEIYDVISLDLESAESLGYKTIRNYNVWSWLTTKELDPSLKGIWKINFSIDEEIVLTRQFVFY